MGRPPTGWKLRLPPNSTIYCVRFTHAGKRVERSTGERDRERAARSAAEIYAQTVGGITPRASIGEPFVRGAAQWLAATDALRDVTTNETYRGYVSKHLDPFFRTVDAVTTDSARAYSALRLQSVKRVTLLKELSVLRQIVVFRLGDHAPMIPDPPRRAIGTAHKMGRLGQAPDLSALEILKVIRRVPRGLVRSYFLALWETGLRPETIKTMEQPRNYTPGRRRLWIDAEQDKARAGRWVPITALADLTLARVAAKRTGPIFAGVGQHRKALRRAARAVLPADKARVLTTYHLRGARITHWLERTHNVAGVMQLVGHVRLETTAKYLRPSERAALLVLGK